MAHTMTHTTNKNDAGEITGYDIKADGVTVGSAAKSDKGKFTFTPAWDDGSEISDVKTMRDLKSAAEKALPKDFVANNKPETPAKAAKSTVSAEKTEAEEAAIAAAAAGEDEDIDLD